MILFLVLCPLRELFSFCAATFNSDGFVGSNLEGVGRHQLLCCQILTHSNTDGSNSQRVTICVNFAEPPCVVFGQMRPSGALVRVRPSHLLCQQIERNN